MGFESPPNLWVPAGCCDSACNLQVVLKELPFQISVCQTVVCHLGECAVLPAHPSYPMLLTARAWKIPLQGNRHTVKVKLVPADGGGFCLPLPTLGVQGRKVGHHKASLCVRKTSHARDAAGRKQRTAERPVLNLIAKHL